MNEPLSQSELSVKCWTINFDRTTSLSTHVIFARIVNKLEVLQGVNNLFKLLSFFGVKETFLINFFHD